MTRALLQMALGTLFLFCVSKIIIRSLPGDPVSVMLAESGFKIEPEQLKNELGLDRSLFRVLTEDTRDLFRLNFGKSLQTRQPIAPELKNRFQKTLQLSLVAALIGLLLALPLGVFSVVSPQVDRICSLFGSLTAALPTSWIGPLFSLLLGVWIPLFPLTEHIALPALTLGIGIAGYWSRLIRERVRQNYHRPSTVAGRARGLTEIKLLFKYSIAPSGGFLIGLFFLGFGSLLSGAFITETLFGWEGLGSWMIESILRRDYTVFEATFFVTTLCSLTANRVGTLIAEWMGSVGHPN